MVRSLRLGPALLAVLTSTTIRERRNRQASPGTASQGRDPRGRRPGDGHGVAAGPVSTEAALHGKRSGSSRYTDDPCRSAAQMAPPPTASSPRTGSPVMPEGLTSGAMHSSAPPAASRSVIQTAPTPAAKPVGRPLGTI